MRAIRTPERDRELGKIRKARYIAKYPARNIWRHLRRRAAKEGALCMSVSLFESWYIKQEQRCVYCGMDATTAKVVFGHALHVDRKDASAGYVADNIGLACHRCNVVKSRYLTADQMREVASRYFCGTRGNAHDALVSALKQTLGAMKSAADCLVADPSHDIALAALMETARRRALGVLSKCDQLSAESATKLDYDKIFPKYEPPKIARRRRSEELHPR